MFELSRTIARNAQSDVEDSKNVKMALTSLGYYDDTETGLSPYGDDQLFESIKDFQKGHDLKVDGVMKPKGLTETRIVQKLKSNKSAGNVFTDFKRNFDDMNDAKTHGADKYFHCKANYQAAKRGWVSKATARFLSDAKEAKDKYYESYPDSDIVMDQHANFHGRKAADSGYYKSAEEACAIFRPKSLDKRY